MENVIPFKSKPVAKKKYEHVEKPEPEGTFGKITDKIREEAKSLQEGGIFITEFIRTSEPRLNKVSVCIDSNCLSKTFVKGKPVGALVAFMKGRKILVGWSFYNKNHEVATFTRKDAVRIAILRGLTDGLLTTKSDSGNPIVLTTSNTHIPRIVGKEIPKFIDRARKYYRRAMVDNLRTSMEFMTSQ
jgi:hypothetical protein